MEVLAFFTVSPFVKFFSDMTSFGWPGDELPDNRRERVDRTRTRTTHLCTYRSSAHCPHRCFTHHVNMRGSSQHGSRIVHWCLKRSLSSQRHVSSAAALEHFCTLSLTFPTYLPTFFSLTVLSSGPGSRNLARLTAE